MRKIKVALIGTDWNQNEERRKNNQFGGVTYYRLYQPYKFAKEEFDIDFWNANMQKEAEGKKTEQFYNEFVSRYDVVVTKMIDNPQAAIALVSACKQNGVVLIVDIDDNLFEVRPDQPGYETYYPGSQKRAFAQAYLSYADVIICSTKPLQEYLKEYFSKFDFEDAEYQAIETFPNTIDLEEWDKIPNSSKNQDKIVIGWTGSITHNADLEIIFPAIAHCLKKYKNVHFEIGGGLTLENQKKLIATIDLPPEDKLKISFKGGTHSWDGYPGFLKSMQWDIGIIPVQDDPFNHSKSHIKWMEYSLCKIPSIASKVYPYYMPIDGVDTIIDGETGILAKDNEWIEKLEFMIENPAERERIAKNAKVAMENWRAEKHIAKWVAIIKGATKDKLE